MRAAARLGLTTSLGALALAACSANPPAERAAAEAPPVAAQRPHLVPSPHGAREDEYYWLRDDTRTSPEVLAYLAAENAYAERQLAALEGARDQLYREMAARVPQDDATVPVFEDGDWRYTRFAAGQEHPIFVRRRGSLDAPEEVLLDANVEAARHGFYRAGALAISPDGSLLAWSEDSVGRNQYTIRFRRLSDGVLLPDAIQNAQPEIAWSAAGLLYVERDPTTLLGRWVRVHAPGSGAADRLVYEEPDTSFYLEVERSRSDRFVFIRAQSTLATETRVARADDAALAFEVPLPRERDHLYGLEDHGADWIVRSNAGAPNFRVVRAPMASAADRSTWREIVPQRADAFVERALVFDDFLALEERSAASRRVVLLRFAGGTPRVVAADDAVFSMTFGENPEPSSPTLQVAYESYVTPPSVYDVDVASGARTLRKRDAVSGHDAARYETALVWAPARDGERIPVTLAYRRGTPRDGSAALELNAYGSYGSSSDPFFSGPRLSLLERGVIVATAHVRGGQELGRRWYEAGRLLAKKNTFTDYVDAADHLVAEGWTRRGRILAVGGSAGGLLMGAVANLAPEHWGAMLNYVPFVDVVTTMLDESIPLTTNEFDEWGNPKQREYYDYMLSYSPYDQLGAQAYPPLLVRTGLWDSQVQYWEPAKYVARLRARRANAAPLLLLTQMEAGHGGRAGRFERLRDLAIDYAFALSQLGVPVVPAAPR